MLRIYNSLTNKKEEFIPIEPGKISIYVCGMTVYDYCHIGHARVLVVFDMAVRYLRSIGYDVTYIRNITDIDDKIIQRANENKENFSLLTERFIRAMHEDAEALNILPPNDEPKATDHMLNIIRMVTDLINNDYAYAADNGDVYYSVDRFEGYGKLSGKKLDELRAGERVAINTEKKEPMDFVLWKKAKPDEPSWDSPWGKGRPGWHIECSAMSTCCLGNHFDIHGGGQDLQFPHHENEIAQSEAATGEKFVNYWMHNGFVRIDDEKMSKSLGNFFTIREVLKQYRAEEIRYFILASHYRSPLNYSDTLLDSAQSALARLYTSLRGININTEELDQASLDQFNESMSEDFNTAEALAVLFELANKINKAKDVTLDKAVIYANTLKHLGGVLGILEANPDEYLKSSIGAQNNGDDVHIDALVAERVQAKKDKHWSRADEIRDQLKELGIELEDTGLETIWRRI